MPLQFNTVKLFAGSGTLELAEKISKSYEKQLGDMTLSKFSDGEIQHFYNESVRGINVILIQSTNQPSDNLLQLLLMIDAAKRASAHYITIVIPCFGFARQVRKDKLRVAIGAKMIANLFTAAGAHRMMT